MDALIKAATKVPTVPKGASVLERARIDQGKLVVEEKLLKPIKCLCKKEPAQIDEAKRYLFLDLFSKKLVVRVRCLRIIDALFLRSSRLRDLVCDDIREMLRSGSLIDAPPLQSSSRDDGIVYFERQILHTLELWDVQFGHNYPVLRATARYLRESLKKKMPNVAQSAKEYDEQRKRREVAQSRVIKAKRSQVFTETNEELPELKDDVRKMEEYFDMLVPDLRNLMSNRALASIMSDSNADDNDNDNDNDNESGGVDADADGGNGEKIAPGKTQLQDRKRSREEEDDDDDDVDWEEDEEGAAESATDQAFASHVAAKAPAVDALALNPMPIVVDLHRDREGISAEGGGEGGSGKGMDTEVTRAMKKHAVYLAKHALPRLQRWQDSLVKARAGAGAGAGGTDAGEWAAARATGALLREVAILNARLRRLLLEKCAVVFKDLPLATLVMKDS